MKTIPLNIMLSYPVQWKKSQILRDIVQNFYDDAGMRRFNEAFKTAYDPEEGAATLTLASKGFSYEWLLHMGASTKQDQRGKFAGFFGEGFKIAVLCALRDFNWKIKMRSSNWALEVVIVETVVDDKKLQQLAYNVEEGLSNSGETLLSISSFTKEDNILLEDVVLGFFFPENPLLGKRIFENEYAAIYERSARPKPAHFPHGLDWGGDGIVFIGFQARGAFVRPLVLCNHCFTTDERDRHDIFSGTVLDALIDLVDLIDVFACCYMLEQLERYWYDYPDKKSDVVSWYALVRKLVRKVAFYDPALASDFKNKHSSLAVCEQPINQRMRNQKTQALAWMKRNLPNARLVQDSFTLLGYKTIVDLCDKAGGFNLTRTPTPAESALLDILWKAAKEIAPGFFETCPHCLIIENESSVANGTANIYKNKEIKYSVQGYRFRYKLSTVELRRGLLAKDSFSKAFSTYCHELCHCFGGDASEVFSRALTDMMAHMVENKETLQQYNRLWLEQFDSRY